MATTKEKKTNLDTLMRLLLHDCGVLVLEVLERAGKCKSGYLFFHLNCCSEWTGLYSTAAKLCRHIFRISVTYVYWRRGNTRRKSARLGLA